MHLDSVRVDAYRGQRNLITKMNKKAEYDHFNRTIQAFKNDSKAFWKSCKPFFSNSSPVETQFSLNHNGHIIQNSSEIANILSVHYSKVTKSLSLRDWNPLHNSELTDPVLRAAEKFKSHPSIVNIKTDNSSLTCTFSFREVT